VDGSVFAADVAAGPGAYGQPPSHSSSTSNRVMPPAASTGQPATARVVKGASSAACRQKRCCSASTTADLGRVDCTSGVADRQPLAKVSRQSSTGLRRRLHRAAKAHGSDTMMAYRLPTSVHHLLTAKLCASKACAGWPGCGFLVDIPTRFSSSARASKPFRPRRLGTSTVYSTPGGAADGPSTSSASRSIGIALGGRERRYFDLGVAAVAERINQMRPWCQWG
jgi:hypothetical protein